MSETSGVGSRPVAPFIGPRRKPKAWGRIGYCPPGKVGWARQSGRLAMLRRIAKPSCAGGHTYAPATSAGLACDRCEHVSFTEACGHRHGKYGCTTATCLYGSR